MRVCIWGCCPSQAWRSDQAKAPLPLRALTARPEGSVVQHRSFLLPVIRSACFSQSILCEKWMLALPVLVIPGLQWRLPCLFRGDTGSPNRRVSSRFLTGCVHHSRTPGLPVGWLGISPGERLPEWLRLLYTCCYLFHGVGSWLAPIFATVCLTHDFNVSYLSLLLTQWLLVYCRFCLPQSHRSHSVNCSNNNSFHSFPWGLFFVQFSQTPSETVFPKSLATQLDWNRFLRGTDNCRPRVQKCMLMGQAGLMGPQGCFSAGSCLFLKHVSAQCKRQQCSPLQYKHPVKAVNGCHPGSLGFDAPCQCIHIFRLPWYWQNNTNQCHY